MSWCMAGLGAPQETSKASAATSPQVTKVDLGKKDATGRGLGAMPTHTGVPLLLPWLCGAGPLWTGAAEELSHFNCLKRLNGVTASHQITPCQHRWAPCAIALLGAGFWHGMARHNTAHCPPHQGPGWPCSRAPGSPRGLREEGLGAGTLPGPGPMDGAGVWGFPPLPQPTATHACPTGRATPRQHSELGTTLGWRWEARQWRWAPCAPQHPLAAQPGPRLPFPVKAGAGAG